MASKMVTLRQRKARAVGAALATHGDKVVQALTEQLTPLVEDGEAAPEIAPMLTLLHRRLGRLRKDMVRVDEAHIEEERIGRERRQQRDRATAVLIDQVIETRRLLEGTFGSKEGERISGLSGRTDRTPLEVLRQAERLVGHLTDPDLELPPEVHDGVQLDPLAVAEQLHAPLQALRTALDDLDHFLRERESTLVAKAHILEEFDATLAPTSLVVEGLLRLAGQPEFADRLRAFPRRPSPAGDPADGGQPDEAEADGEASADGGDTGSGDSGGETVGGTGGDDDGASIPGDDTPGGADPVAVPPPPASGGSVTPAAPS